MKITTTSEDTYPTLTNNALDGRYPIITYSSAGNISNKSTDDYITYVPANGELYADFIGSLSLDKTRAINAAYDNGYITEEEVKQLKEEGHARRNDTTDITIYETYTKVEMLCLESTIEDDLAHFETIFKLSYDKMSGFLVDEMNIDIAN